MPSQLSQRHIAYGARVDRVTFAGCETSHAGEKRHNVTRESLDHTRCDVVTLVTVGEGRVRV